MSLASRLVCAACHTALDADEPWPFRCPHSNLEGDVDHLLEVELDLEATEFPTVFPTDESPNPFIRYRSLLHSYRFARRNGVSDANYIARVEEIDAAIFACDARRFQPTPLVHADPLLDAPLWIKDETGNVSGSHKARHLMGLALQLSFAGSEENPLAISSCGNAALAAAVVARATKRTLKTFVPENADPKILARLQELGAQVVNCARTPGLSGDPCTRNFRDAVANGAVPFSVQGSDNGLALEGGRTLAWEVVTQFQEASSPLPDSVTIQVGGGALGSSFVQGLEIARTLGAIATLPRLLFVQTESVAPLHRAYARISAEAHAACDEVFVERPGHELARWWLEHAADERVRAVRVEARRHRSRYLPPWPLPKPSVASGILDDETYDGFRLLDAMLDTGGWPLVVSEQELELANALANTFPGVSVDATGSAGLAGWVQARQANKLDDASGLILFTGVRR